MTDRCDIIMTPGHEVYLNGTMIGRIIQFDVSHDPRGGLPEVTLTMQPTSIIYGEVPTVTLADLQVDQHPDDSTVDIHRAISRAHARRAGLPGAVMVSVAQQPVVQPTAVSKPARATYPVHDPIVAEDPEQVCSAGVGGGDICTRPYGHPGNHRS